MRVLVVSAPMLGHLLPMVPLARALRDAGDEVLLATAGDAVTGRGVGLSIEDIAPTLRFGPVVRRPAPEQIVARLHALAAHSTLADSCGDHERLPGSATRRVWGGGHDY